MGTLTAHIGENTASLSRSFANIRKQSLAVRQAEIVASLSLVADIGTGQPTRQAQKTCLLAPGVAREMGLADSDVRDLVSECWRPSRLR